MRFLEDTTTWSIDSVKHLALTCVRWQPDGFPVSLDGPPTVRERLQTVGGRRLGNMNRIVLILVNVLTPSVQYAHLQIKMLKTNAANPRFRKHNSGQSCSRPGRAFQP